MREIDDITYNEIFATTLTPILIYFWATWCMPCKMKTPMIENLAQQFEGKVLFTKADSDLTSEMKKLFEIKGTPTVIILNKGMVVKNIVGKNITRENIELILNELL